MWLFLIGAAAVLIGLHWTCGALAVRWPALGTLIQGKPTVLFDHGALRMEAMRRSHITPDNMLEHLRHNTHMDDFAEIERALLECNGQISLVKSRQTVKRDRE